MADNTPSFFSVTNSGIVANQANKDDSFAGVQPAQANVAQVDRPIPVEPVDLAGASRLESDLSAAYNNPKGAKTLQGASQFAQDDFNLRFQAQSGASVENLTLLANHQQALTGDTYTPEQQQVLAQFQSQIDQVKAAKDQRPDLNEQFALGILRNNFIKANPGLAPEAVALSSSLNTINKPLDDSAYRRAKLQQANQDEATKTLYTAVQVHGQDTSQMSTDQVRAWANQNILPMQQRITAGEEQWKAADNDSKLTTLQKTQAKDDAIQQITPDLIRTVIPGVRQAMDALGPSATAQQRASAGTDALTQFQGTLRQKFGITTDADFQSRFGYIFDPIKTNMNDYATGKLTSEGLTARNNIIVQSATTELLNKVPQLAYLQSLGKEMGLAPLLAPFADRPEYVKMMTQVVQSLGQSIAGTDKTVVPTLDVTGGKGINASQSDVTAAAKVAAGVASSVMAKSDAKPELKQAAVGAALSVLSDTTQYRDRNLEGVRQVASTIADDRWLDMSKGMRVPQAAIDMSETYLDSIKRSSAPLIQKEGDNLIVTVDTNGAVNFSQKLPNGNAGKLARLTQDLNDGVGMYAHLHGSNDRAGVLRMLGAN